MADSKIRVRVFIDFWNFQLRWNAVNNPKPNEPLVSIPWKELPQILTTEAAKGQAAKFAGVHVYASVNASSQKDRNLNNWFHHTLASFTGYTVDVRERKPRNRAVRCEGCKASIANCPSCQMPLRSAGEKGVDAAIITDLITSAFDDNYDVAVLISGDADIAPVVRYIQKKTDKQVVQAYFRSHGDELRNACWDHIFFDDLMPKLIPIPPKSPHAGTSPV
jgi:uncharacterized LabA/DUF88 family protein